MISELTVQFITSFRISFASVFLVFKIAKEFGFLIKFYVSSPFSGRFMQGNAFYSRRVGTPMSNIAHILGMSGPSKIIPSVVESVFIPVIHTPFRPFSGLHCPDDPMSFIETPEKTNKNAPVRGVATGNIPSLSSTPCRHLPSQDAGLRVIIENLFQLLRLNHAVMVSAIPTEGKF